MYALIHVRSIFQPFRSTPLILPKAKTTKDIPVGSYLRFDPLTKKSTPGSRLGDNYMLSKVSAIAITNYIHSLSTIANPGAS